MISFNTNNIFLENIIFKNNKKQLVKKAEQYFKDCSPFMLLKSNTLAWHDTIVMPYFIIPEFILDIDPKYQKIKNKYHLNPETVAFTLSRLFFISKALYTYIIAGETEFEVKPLYILSQYKHVVGENITKKNTEYHKHTKPVVDDDEFVNKFFKVERCGYKDFKTWNHRCYCTRYSLTNYAKNLAQQWLSNPKLFVFDITKFDFRTKYLKLPNVVKHGHGNTVERHLEYYCGLKQHVSMNDFRAVCPNAVRPDTRPSKRPGLSAAETYVRVNMSYVYLAYKHFQAANNTHDIAILNTLTDIITNVTEDGYIQIEYNQVAGGRFYDRYIHIQNLPKYMREGILSEYVAVDMNASVHSLIIGVAKKFGYTGSLKYLHKYIECKASIREYLSQKTGLTIQTIKQAISAIAFGGRIAYNNLEKVKEYKAPLRDCLANITGMTIKAYVALVDDPFFKAMYVEIRTAMTFILKKHVKRGKLINAFGTVYECPSNQKRARFAQRCAFIMQSYEALILKFVMKEFTINGKVVNHNDNIGLYLHDGFYLKKSYVKRVGWKTIIENLVKSIKEKFGFDVAYDIEWSEHDDVSKYPEYGVIAA